MDPLFLHELALELKMTVADLGQRMSVRELHSWTEFFAYRHRENERQREKEETQSPRGFG